jgi:hypothetical protein
MVLAGAKAAVETDTGLFRQGSYLHLYYTPWDISHDTRHAASRGGRDGQGMQTALET